MLLESLLTTKGPIAVFAVKGVCWGIKVLSESLLATKGPIAVFAVEGVCWGVKVLSESLLATKLSLAVDAVVGYFRRTNYAGLNEEGMTLS